MTEQSAISVVAAILEGEASLPSQRRVLLRLQDRFPDLDWFRIALDCYPTWEPDIDLSETDHDWRGWVDEDIDTDLE